MVHILGQKTEIPGVPAKALRRNPDGSIGIDVGCMNRDEKLAFVMQRWQQLENTVSWHDQVLGDLVRLNYVAGAAVELLAQALELEVDEVLRLVLEEAERARVESRALARAKPGDTFEAKSTTLRLTTLLRQVGRTTSPEAQAAAATATENTP
jgi:hypothetical protein